MTKAKQTSNEHLTDLTIYNHPSSLLSRKNNMRKSTIQASQYIAWTKD
jgi:hypothetical protein